MRTTKNIVEELDRFVPSRDKHMIIEARAMNIIASAVNLLDIMKQNLSEEESFELTKRLLGAIRLNDPKKFQRKIREYKRVDEEKKKNV